MDQEQPASVTSTDSHDLADRPPEVSGKGHFPKTRWTLVQEMQDPDSTVRADRALNELCQLYWHPVYAYIRTWGKSAADAEDLTQGFFSMILARNALEFVAPEKGKLRTFLLVTLKRYMASEHQRGSAQKRGGGQVPVSIDIEWAEGHFHFEPASHLTPDVLFDRQWALTVLDHVVARLKDLYVSTGKGKVFEALKSTISPEGAKRPLAEIAADLGITEGAAKVTAHRLRKNYRRLLEEAIAETVGSEEAVEEEIRHLLSVFGD
jgi:DNA-directed RNA polymerase specialized sigma24 family protein